MKTYNHLIPQRALKHLSPVQVLKDWYARKPELFKKRVYNQPGLDSYVLVANDSQRYINMIRDIARGGYTLITTKLTEERFPVGSGCCSA